ncbi:unnamed protein product [Adineta ricciae]|uniref:N-acetylglucosaminylphosphatidylinositol deacetylase n=1 Tax=Adineta ricciae TaxID=249248 RepID=A0A814X172_ADIRI|nr:unnamed protein product [Adineta ricciae]CAF1209423.1 unnamed protein product [Adineta ricciae]
MVMIGFTLAVLVVIAHPDDETLFSGFLHALTHKLNASVDLVCITNGEGGFQHSAPSESLYGSLQLSNETIARQHLPRIRKQELLGSGKILGIRKYFFYDQIDLKYDRDVENVLSKQWNKELIIQLLEQTITTGNGQQGYNLMLVMLPSVQSHGHHTASGLLALETIKRLRDKQLDEMKLPIVIGGSEFVLSDRPIYSLNSLAETSAEFRFYRKWKLSSSSEISDYQMIVLWVCGEHKSQGGLIAETLTLLARDNEQYFYFTLNNNTQKFRMINTLFKQLTDMHDYDSGNML